MKGYMTDIEKYVFDSGALAYTDMRRDQKFAHMGVIPLWTDCGSAWLWFSGTFLDSLAGDREKMRELFKQGWESASNG